MKLNEDAIFCPQCGEKHFKDLEQPPSNTDTVPLNKVSCGYRSIQGKFSKQASRTPLQSKSGKRVSYVMTKRKYFCASCGSEVGYMDKFCLKCGMAQANKEQQSKNFEIVDNHVPLAVAALFMCIPLGIIAMALAGSVTRSLDNNNINDAKVKANAVYIISIVGIAIGAVVGLSLMINILSPTLQSQSRESYRNNYDWTFTY